MNARVLLLPLLLVPALALAQTDDWSSFPTTDAPAAQPAETTTPPAAAQPEKARPAAKPEEKKADPKKSDAPANSAATPAPDAAAPATAPANEATAPAQPMTTLPPMDAPGSGAATTSDAASSGTAAAAAPGTASATENASAAEPVVVSQEERYLAGTEPHSPSTWGRSWTLDNRRSSPSLSGSRGLMSVSSAMIGKAGLLEFGVLGEYMNQRDFPVRNATNVRTAGSFSVSYSPTNWLESYLTYGASANTNTFSSPTLIQALGDVTLGVKAARQWTSGLHAGLELNLQSFSGVGNQDVSRYAWGVAPRAVLSYDLRAHGPKSGERAGFAKELFTRPILHANVGANFDSTGGLVKQHKLNASEEFALGVNKYNRFTAGLGLEVPLPVVTPFAEWNLEVPLGVENGELVAPNGSTVPMTAAMPHWFSIGAKLTPVKDLTLVAGGSFGLARTVGLGVPATPPWNLTFGAAFNIDPFQRGETKLVETLRERRVEAPVAAPPAAPTRAKVEGVVVDAQTKKPVPGVIVAMVGAGVPPVASDYESGRFLTHELPPGAVTLKVEKAGYKEAQQQVTLEPGKTANVELALEPMAKLAHFAFTAVDAKSKAPVAAEVRLKGPVEQTVSLAAATAPTTQDLPPGKYVVNVVSPDHLAQTREVAVTENAELKLDFALEAKPKKKLVVVKQDKIDILQQVHFATGKATILADSFSLLNQVVDAIVTNDIKRIRVEGHTDNKGGKKKNLKLSEDRAKAVAEYLVKQGIDPSRIETQGFGDAKPVAPNLTARGRELNRRVEFVILER